MFFIAQTCSQLEFATWSRNRCFFVCLIRFSQFFISPLFTPSATEKEVNAVNSENDRNLQSDGHRIYQLEKSLAKKRHDYAKFGTGIFAACIASWPFSMQFW